MSAWHALDAGRLEHDHSPTPNQKGLLFQKYQSQYMYIHIDSVYIYTVQCTDGILYGIAKSVPQLLLCHSAVPELSLKPSLNSQNGRPCAKKEGKPA